MKTIRIQPRHIEERCAQRGDGYRAEIMPAMLYKLDDGTMIFDMTHPAWRACTKKYHPKRQRPKMPSPLPALTIPPREPPRKLSEDEQAAWLLRVLPTCQGCTAFKGIADTPDYHIKKRIACAECHTCGSNTVGPLQKCPLGKW